MNDWLGHRPMKRWQRRLVSSVFFSGAIIFILLLIWPLLFDWPDPRIDGVPMWSAQGAFYIVIALGVATLIGFVGVSILREEDKRPLEERVRGLIETLQSSVLTANELEQTIAERLKLAEEVKQQLERDKNLARLTEEETRAVTEAVDQVLRRERWPAFWMQVCIALASLVLGFLLGRFF